MSPISNDFNKNPRNGWKVLQLLELGLLFPFTCEQFFFKHLLELSNYFFAFII